MDKCFSGYINNSEMLRRSASGGFATAFAMKVIEEKGVVYGVTYSSDFKSVTWIRIDTVFKFVYTVLYLKRIRCDLVIFIDPVTQDF